MAKGGGGGEGSFDVTRVSRFSLCNGKTESLSDNLIYTQILGIEKSFRLQYLIQLFINVNGGDGRERGVGVFSGSQIYIVLFFFTTYV